MDAVVYIFNANPGSDFQYYLPVLIFAAFIFLFGLFVFLKCRFDKIFRKLFKETAGNYFTIATIILILLGSRYQSVPFISMRFLLGITLLFSLYIVVKALIKFFKEYPKLKEKIEHNAQKMIKKDYSHSKKKK